jgi:ATP-dependent protease ClpP protease subunit
MSDKLNEDIDRFLEHGLYLETRTIVIEPEGDLDDDDKGELSQKCALNTVKKIHILDNYKEGTINVIINLPGGSVADGFAIYDAIKACKNLVRGYVYGICDSMASIILQACDERCISEHSRVMIHNGTASYPGDSKEEDIRRWQEYNKKLDERCWDIYLEKIKEKHPNYRKQDLKRRMDTDMIFIGDEAIEFGLADRIVKRGE